MTQVRASQLTPGMTVQSLFGERCTVARVDNHGYLVAIQYDNGTGESARPDALLNLLADGLTREAKELGIAEALDRVIALAADVQLQFTRHLKTDTVSEAEKQLGVLTASQDHLSVARQDLMRLAMAATVD